MGWKVLLILSLLVLLLPLLIRDAVTRVFSQQAHVVHALGFVWWFTVPAMSRLQTTWVQCPVRLPSSHMPAEQLLLQVCTKEGQLMPCPPLFRPPRPLPPGRPLPSPYVGLT